MAAPDAVKTAEPEGAAAPAVRPAYLVDDVVHIPPAPEAWGAWFVWRAKTWFLDHENTRTAEQIENEKWLFPWLFGKRVPFSRWLIPLPVLVCQLCIGSLYSWSIFNSTLDKVWGTPGLNANAFMVAVGCFGLTALLFGTWVERNGPWASVMATLFLTPGGWALGCLGAYISSLPLVIAGFGILHGAGAAMTYISVTSCLQRWFLDLKGLATGIAVMGFGLGSLIVTSAGKDLLNPAGPYHWPVYKVMGVFGATFFVAIALSVPFLREPPPGYKPGSQAYVNEQSVRGWLVRKFATKSKRTPEADKHYSFVGALRTQEFALLALMFFGVEITGVVFLSSASDMTQYIFGYDAAYAGTITAALNTVNFLGRVGFGFLSDKIGRKSFYLFSAATQAFAVGLMALWIGQGNFDLWLTSFLLVGACYGGGFGVIPAAVSDLFGAKISAATHGVMIAVWSAAGIIGIPIFGSFTAKYYHLNTKGAKIPDAGAYIDNAYWLCGLPALSFVALLFMNVRVRDRRLRQAKGDLRVRLFSHVLRINWAEGGVALLSAAQQEAEYDEWVASADAGAVAATKYALPQTPYAASDAGSDVGSAAPSRTTSSSTLQLHAAAGNPTAVV